ncbi:MAG TPA: AAA family ATPase, partial [Candidatus Saccharimonadia bacterium]|nr:AAA family ATPase [Candidatus Saccharimonadia bacterium]
MTFEELLDEAIDLLQRRGRVTYRTLKRQFQLDDDVLEDLKEEIIYGQRLAVDEDGRVLVWTGGASAPPESIASPLLPQEGAHATPSTSAASSSSAPHTSDAERRQLTVLFCDLVDSTTLSSRLDPEDLREVVLAYQEACAKVIARFEGHIAQYLGDGLLVYFGYPLAHEDDAQRAVRAGLGIIEALGQLNTRLAQERGVHLAVRLGIHTGLVVVGEMGGGTRREQLALGETPNLAARLQGIAAPNTLVISATTYQLLGGFFAYQSLGTRLLRGFPQPLEVYQVLYESMARSRLEAAGSTGLTPLVGREQEVALLLERWEQVKDGLGQVVLLSGEAGIGKSRLVQVLTEHIATEPQAWLTPCQCSPYYQNTALYPMIELLERVALRFAREESPQQKLSKLEGFVVQYGLPLAETVPLFAALLSLPLGADYAPLAGSPAQQKQQTLHAFLTILLRIAAQQPVLFVMEDLHWVDPSTLELLSLLVDQGPTSRILVLLTFRPDFSPPWTGRSHFTQVMLPRLPRRQAAEMTGRVAHSKALPPEVVEQVVAKTDGVPLFVEELTKMVGETPQLFRGLWGLYAFYLLRAEPQTARELGEQLLTLAQHVQAPAFLVEAHFALGNTLLWLGELASSRAHLAQGIALYDRLEQRATAFLLTGYDPGMALFSFLSHVLWYLGYPDQALQRSHEAVTLARELSHPYSLAFALSFAMRLHQFRRERQAAQKQAEALMALASEQGFA